MPVQAQADGADEAQRAGQIADQAAVSGDPAPQPATAALNPERALAMLKRLLAEHGMTELPALTELPAPHSQAPDQTLPAGVEALVAALASALLKATPPDMSPVVAETSTLPAGSVVAPAAESGAQLERFIREVAAALMSERPAPADGQAASGQPMFQELVRLIGGASPERAPTEARAPTPVQVLTEAVVAVQQEAGTQDGVQPQTQARPQQPPQPQIQVQAPQSLQPVITRARPAEPAESPTPAPSAMPQLQAASPLTPTDPANPAPAQPRPPIDPEQVIRQAARFVKVALAGQRSEVRFQMHPDQLGAIVVRLVLTEGTVKASMTAADPAVKAVLEANLEQLRTRLADQGFRVEQIQVTLGGGSASGQSHQSPNDGQQQPRQPGQYRSQDRQGNPEPTNEQSERRSARTWLPGRKGSRIDSLA